MFGQRFPALGAQFGKNRQRQNLRRGRLRRRQIARLVSKKAEAVLEMQRNRIIDRRTDLVAAKRGQHRIAPTIFDADGELVVNVPVTGHLAWNGDQVEQAELRKEAFVALGICAAGLGPTLEMRQLDV